MACWADLTEDINVCVVSPADLAEGVTVGVASSTDLAGDVTVGVTSSAEPDSVVTVGVVSMEECRDSGVLPSDCVCDYADYFYDGQHDDCPDYYDYDDPDVYVRFPIVYGFVGPDDYELYHDLHGSDGCGVYVCLGALSARMCHTGATIRDMMVQRSDAILPRIGSDESPAVLEDSGLGYNRLGRPRYGTGEAAETPQEMVVDSECRDTVMGTLEGEQMYMVDPRSVSKLSCDPVCSMSDKLVHRPNSLLQSAG